MSRRRYPHLDWYIDSSRTGSAFLLAVFIALGLSPLALGAASGDFRPVVPILFVTVPVFIGLGYVIYKFRMAVADFLAAIRDIEENTRRTLVFQTQVHQVNQANLANLARSRMHQGGVARDSAEDAAIEMLKSAETPDPNSVLGMLRRAEDGVDADAIESGEVADGGKVAKFKLPGWEKNP